MDWQLVQCTCKRVAFYPNSSCDLLEIHELLRSNAGVESVYTPERRKPMDEKIIATYGLCDDLLKAMHQRADPQCKMS